jgi:hypothetical protein
MEGLMADHAKLFATCALGLAMATAAAPAIVAVTGPSPVKAAPETRLSIIVEEPSRLRDTRLKVGQLCPVPQVQDSAAGDSAAPAALPSPMVPRMMAQR